MNIWSRGCGRMFHLGSLLILTTLLCAAQVHGQATRGATAQTERTVEVWQTFRSPECRCRVDVPGIPDHKSSFVETQLGQAEMHGYDVETATANYSVIYTDFPNEAGAPLLVEKGYDNGRDRVLAVGKAWLVGEHTLKMGKLIGREFVIEDGLKRVTFRMYFDGTRLYQLMFSSPVSGNMPDGILKYYDALSNRFFTSFAIEPNASKKVAAKR